MANQPDRHLRAMLPIPDVVMPGLTTYDAKDPGTKYPPTGKINWVQIDVGKDDHDHFIDPEERLRVAMARQ